MDISIDDFHAALDARNAQRQAAGIHRTPPPTGKETAGENDGKGDGVDAEKHLFGEDGFTFADILDIINPLQHIPIISTLYREISGDKIAMMPRILGGSLFGGPIGAAVAVANAALAQGTGKDLGEHAVAVFTGDDAPVTAVAEAPPPEASMTTAAGSFAAPTRAELDILAAEAAVAHKAHPGQTAEPAPPLEAAQPNPLAALAVVAPTAAEEKILAAEAVFARLESKRITPQQAFSTVTADPGTDPGPARLAALPPQPRPNPLFAPESSHRAGAPSPWLPFAPPADGQTGTPAAQAAPPTAPTVHPAFDVGGIPPRGDVGGIPPRGDIGGIPPRGAVAAKGGWFSDVMLSALNKYEKSRQLKQPAAAPALDRLH
ncbi:MAG: hypothetical protein WD407_10150 [Rhodospirillales bacterium]